MEYPDVTTRRSGEDPLASRYFHSTSKWTEAGVVVQVGLADEGAVEDAVVEVWEVVLDTGNGLG